MVYNIKKKQFYYAEKSGCLPIIANTNYSTEYSTFHNNVPENIAEQFHFYIY